MQGNSVCNNSTHAARQYCMQVFLQKPASFKKRQLQQMLSMLRLRVTSIVSGLCPVKARVVKLQHQIRAGVLKLLWLLVMETWTASSQSSLAWWCLRLRYAQAGYYVSDLWQNSDLCWFEPLHWAPREMPCQIVLTQNHHCSHNAVTGVQLHGPCTKHVRITSVTTSRSLCSSKCGC